MNARECVWYIYICKYFNKWNHMREKNAKYIKIMYDIRTVFSNKHIIHLYAYWPLVWNMAPEQLSSSNHPFLEPFWTSIVHTLGASHILVPPVYYRIGVGKGAPNKCIHNVPGSWKKSPNGGEYKFTFEKQKFLERSFFSEDWSPGKKIRCKSPSVSSRPSIEKMWRVAASTLILVCIWPSCEKMQGI